MPEIPRATLRSADRSGDDSRDEVDHLLGDDAVVGAQIGIVYDPNAPSNAAVSGQPAVDPNSDWLLIVLGVVCFGLAVARVAFVIRRRRWNARPRSA